MAHVSEYDVESLFIDRLESIGYRFVDIANYDDVVANFREQLTVFNAQKLIEAKGAAALSDAEFGRVMIHVDNKSVYESAKILRDKYVLTLDNGKTVYLDFFSSDTDRNIYQVTHQVTMDKNVDCQGMTRAQCACFFSVWRNGMYKRYWNEHQRGVN